MMNRRRRSEVMLKAVLNKVKKKIDFSIQDDEVKLLADSNDVMSPTEDDLMTNSNTGLTYSTLKNVVTDNLCSVISIERLTESPINEELNLESANFENEFEIPVEQTSTLDLGAILSENEFERPALDSNIIMLLGNESREPELVPKTMEFESNNEFGELNIDSSEVQQIADINVVVEVLREQQPSTSGIQVTSTQPNTQAKRKTRGKKSYIDFMSEEEADFDWSSSSWDGCEMSNSDSNVDESSRKKNKRHNSQEEGKVGNEGLKKKKKLNKRKERKILRTQGKEYSTKSGTVVRARKLQPNPCLNKKCGRSCHDISEERRHSLFTYYHSLSTERKRDWIVSNSQIENTKRKRSKDGNSRRTNSFLYFINEGEGRRQVCLQFILRTLDVTQRYIYYTLSNAKFKLSKSDLRGKHVPPNKTTEQLRESVVDYIKNLPAVPSHYCRSDSTRLYLPQELRNISNLYQLYKKDFQSKGIDTVGEKIFRNIFSTDFNITFHVPKKDKCIKCISFKNNPNESAVNKEAHEKEANDSKNRFKFHQEINKTNPNTLCVSFDLQKVLGTPYGESMLFYYTRKYSVYNLTLYESSTREVLCYTWGEADGNRGGNEVGTILFNYIKLLDERQTVKNVIFYSDSCSGQNKNKIVFAAVHTALQYCQFIDTIQMNFLLPGHTTMPVDSVHAVIEKSVVNMIIYAPSQWPTVFELARKNPKPYKVEVLTYKDFKAWDAIADKYFKNNLVGKISKIRIITFKKSDLKFVYIKNSMSETTVSEKIEVLGKNKLLPDNSYKGRLPISNQKHSDLVKLCKTFAIPQRYHSEYLNLRSSTNKADVLLDSDCEDIPDVEINEK